LLSGSLDASLQTRPAGSPAASPGSPATLSRLTVSPDRRYLVRADGTPFLYLSDTAWELFHRPNREQVKTYLELRAKQKFTVIHAVALAELDGIRDPNAYGDLPLIENNPARPAVTPGSDPANKEQYDYWDNVDYVVNEANRLGMYIAFLPTWARWLGVNPNDEKIINADNAQAYGEFLGKRYGTKGVISGTRRRPHRSGLRRRLAGDGQGDRDRDLREGRLRRRADDLSSGRWSHVVRMVSQ
jgi:hypothetical protein